MIVVDNGHAPEGATEQDCRGGRYHIRRDRVPAVTGDDCYVLHIVLRSIDELEGIIDRFTPLGRTTTSIVNGTRVPRRGIPVGESKAT
jgi:hypothetical protein